MILDITRHPIAMPASGRTWRSRAINGFLAIAVGVVAGAVAPAPPPAYAAPSTTCPAGADTKAAASTAAGACGAQVEVLGARTEQDVLYALPNGSYKAEHRYRPVRVKQADGSWKPVDTTLRIAADGTVVPGATSAGLAFSGGGMSPLVSLTSAGHAVQVGSPFLPLPKPVLAGETATYPEVLPGVDLKVTADVEGYTEVLVVKSRSAATNPALRKVSFPVSGAGLTTVVDAAGNVRINDRAGATVFGGATPTMWDSSDRVAALGRELHAPDGNPMASRREEELVTEVASATGARRAAGTAGAFGEVSQLSVTPSQEFLMDPATVYPVMIDPPQTQYKLNWTYVSADAPNTSFWNSSAQAQTGPIDGHTHRSFFMMSMAGLAYKNIVSATFDITLQWTAGSYWKETDLWDVGSIYSSTTWNNQPAKKTFLGTITVNGPQDLSWNITNQVAYASAHAWSDETVGLYSRSDTDWAYGKKWSNNPGMVVIYNDAPYVPTVPSLYPTDCYRQCVSPAVVRTTTPTLRATVSDPNGGLLRTDYEVRSAPTEDAASLLSSTTTAPAMSGNTADWIVPGAVLVNGGTYYWRARARDELDWLSGWTAFQTLSVDTSPPSLPTVSSAQYPQKAWGAVVGTPGTFTLTSGSGVVDFTWWVDNGSSTTVAASGTTASVTHTPSKDMIHTLHVKAIDMAGNTSGTFDHQFWVQPVANRCWRWQLNQTSGPTAPDTGNTDSNDPVCPPIGSTVTAQNGALSGGVTWGSNVGAAPRDTFASFDGSGQIVMPGPVLDTTKSFTVMAWVRPSDLSAANGYETIVSQDGLNTGRFWLRYNKDANDGAGGWCFGMADADQTNATPADACATDADPSSDSHAPTVGEWVHLAGVYDAVTHEIQIHVMGNPDSCNGERVITPFTSTWSGSGSLVIGRSGTATAPANRWHGDIDNVYVFQRALGAVEICQQVL